MNARAGRVHVSLSELRTAAGRALVGLGAPAGTERDGARSAVWLESRGLRGAAALVSDLRAASATDLRPPEFGSDHPIDFSDCPVLVWGSSLVELAILEAGAAVVLERCRSPRALVPEAAAQAERGWRFRILAGGCEALVARGAIALDRPLADLESADVRIVAEPEPAPAGPPPPSSSSRLSTADLESRHATSLATGLRLDPDDWRTVRRAAARILVPASERSRSRGAGAEVDDNE